MIERLYYKIIRIETVKNGVFDGEFVKSGIGTLAVARAQLEEITYAYNFNAEPSIFALYTEAESEIHNPKSFPVLRAICSNDGFFSD